MAGGTRTAGRVAAAGWNPAGVFWLAFAVLATLPLFGFGLTGLAAAWTRPEYSHGPVIPVLSFYMFLHEMKAVPPAAGGRAGRQPLARRGGDRAVARHGARRQPGADQRPRLLRADRLGVRAGARGLRGAARPGVLAVGAAPRLHAAAAAVPLLAGLAPTLQLVSSEVGVALVRGAGVPVFLEGNVIDLGVYKLQVAEACSGLRYLFPIMSFTYVFAVLYRGPVWHKAGAAPVGGAAGGADERGPDRGDRAPGRPPRHRRGRGLPARLRGLGDLPLLHRHAVSAWPRRCSGSRATAGRSGRRSTSTSPGSGPQIGADPRRRGLAGAGRRRADDRGAVARLEPRPRADRGGAGARRLRALPAHGHRRLGRRAGTAAAAASSRRSRRCSAPTTIWRRSTSRARAPPSRSTSSSAGTPTRPTATRSTRRRSACPAPAGRWRRSRRRRSRCPAPRPASCG